MKLTLFPSFRPPFATVRAAFAAMALAVAVPAPASVTFIGSAVMDGTGTDLSGLTGTLESGLPANLLNGIGSGIAYSGYGNTYYLLTDRGPSTIPYRNGGERDDTTTYPTRFHSFDIVLSGAGSNFTVTATLIGTTLFRNAAGANLVGASDRFVLGNEPEENLRFDPESIRVAPDGTLYVADEFGPSVYHFKRNGDWIEALPVPQKFRISKFTYSGRSNNEMEWNPGSGRIANKGLEGIAITPDGTHLLATMQAPLAQDGGDNTRRTRFILFDLTNPAATPKEFLYLLDQDTDFPGVNISKASVSDAVAISNHQFLIDEREGGATNKKAYIIDITNATDISNIESLAGISDAELSALALPKGIKEFMTLKKLTNNHPEKNNPVPAGYLTGMPDNIEGYTFGPNLPDGRRLLLVTNDNDFLTTGYPNYIMAFAIDPADLPAYKPIAFPLSVG
ncbi:MAG: esterase-like activity of phytase family protein, partial [Verrucomicrobiota bacterium]